MTNSTRIWIVGEGARPRSGLFPELDGVDFQFLASAQEFSQQRDEHRDYLAIIDPDLFSQKPEDFERDNCWPALKNPDDERFRFQVQSFLKDLHLQKEIDIAERIAWKTQLDNEDLPIEFLAKAMLEIFSARHSAGIEQILTTNLRVLADVERLALYENPLFMPKAEASEFHLAIPVQSGGELLAHVYVRFGSGMNERDRDRVAEALIGISDAVGLAITRNRVLARAEESSLIWEASFDAVADPVALIDRDLQIIRSNQAFAKLLKLSKADLAGKKLELISEERIRAFQDFPSAEWEFEFEGRCYRVFLDQIQTDSTEYFGQARMVLRLHDETNEIALRDQILAREQAADMGILIGSVAHEINNPVAGILLYTQLILKQEIGDAQTREDFVEIELATQRMKRIVQTMLSLVRKAEGVAEAVSLRDCLRDVLELIQPELKRLRVRLNIDQQKEEFPVRGVRNKLLQALFQLLQQTLVSLEDPASAAGHGQLHLSLRTREDGADRIPLVALEVRDNARATQQVNESSVVFNVVKILIEEQGGRLEYRREGEQNVQTFLFPLLR